MTTTPRAPVWRRRLEVAPKTVGALALLTVPLPATLAVTGAALLRSLLPGAGTTHPEPPGGRRTILLSGGKMTKALTLARAFHEAGHRVVLVESARYRLTGHRFSRAVDAFHVIPPAGDPGYADALLDVVRREGVDVYVPVCSPASSYQDALAKPLLEKHCEVLHPDADALRTVDDKDRFAAAAVEQGLPVPDTHRVTAPDDVAAFDFDEHPGGRYILKSVPYDPVARLDLTTLPRASRAATAEVAHAKPMSPEAPWILQEYVEGTEYCTHATVRDGRVQVWACCESSAFQLNYAMVDKPEIADWVRRFVAALGASGQLSFDFLETDTGRLVALECNPRTHSAITMFAGHPDLARAYLDDLPDDAPPVTPRPGSRPTYWLYQELWRLVSRPGTAPARLRTLVEGRDAIFSWSDPLPFLLVHHLQIPALLLGNLVAGRDWLRVDVNIGKLVEPAGD